MQAGYHGLLKPFYWLLGEMAPGAVAGVYPSTHLLEGDAVVAETALSGQGRGRRASFLNYYMAAWSEGDVRNWHRWRWGSYRHYAPDHYALGYVTIAGTRYFYDDPMFTADYFSTISRRPWRLFNMQKEIREASQKKFRASFEEIVDGWTDIWAEEAAARGPFIPESQFTPATKWFVSYGGLESGFSTRSGLREDDALWEISPSGKVKRFRPFSSSVSSLYGDGDRIYWTETIPDRRWSLAMTSRIRYIIPSEGRKIYDLTKKGRYYNPAPDGDIVAAVNYPIEGGSRIEILDLEGNVVKSIKAPDEIQAVELTWADGKLYCTGLSKDGIGIYDTEGFKAVLPPQKVAIDNMGENEGHIIFVSDRTGVTEIYELDPEDGSVLQLTATRYGVSNPCFEGDTLFFTSLRQDGEHIFKTTSLLRKKVDFSEIHSDRIADALTAQEKKLATHDVWTGEAPEVSLSQPVRYRKAAHLVNIHSWVPVYMSPDASTSDIESVTEEAGIGATALFQNVLGTATGSFGYSYSPDIQTKRFRHGGHIDITYEGLYPVLQATLRTLNRQSYQYGRQTMTASALTLGQTTARLIDQPAVEMELHAHVPLSFSSGGWSRGLTPQISYVLSNDRFSKGIVKYNTYGGFGDDMTSLFTGYEDGESVMMQTLSASLRGYMMTGTAPSCAFPRWGFGGEVGYRARLSLTDLYTSGIYVAAYGYVPGFAVQQGLRLQMVWQHLFGHDTATGENFILTRPRGFEESTVNRYLAAFVPDQIKLSADYSLPIWVGDISFLSPLMYIKNFLITPHFDCTLLMNDKNLGRGNLITAGADIEVCAANFLWLPNSCSFGIRIDINGGSSYDELASLGFGLERTYIGGLFSVDL